MISRTDVCLGCNPGGHLQSMQLLKPVYEDLDHVVFTYPSVSTEEIDNTVYLRSINYDNLLSIRAIFNFLALTIQLSYYIFKHRPKVAISTGGEIAPLFLYLSKLAGARIIFIENVARRTSRSRAGWLIYPIADRFFVQHEETIDCYGNKAEYWGSII